MEKTSRRKTSGPRIVGALGSSVFGTAFTALIFAALSFAAAAGGGTPAPQAAAKASESVFTLELDPGRRIAVRLDGELFTEYHLDEGHAPYLYPVYGPGGQAMTRNWPMAEAKGEETDHPHHRSLWFAHGDVDGHDFWTGRDGSRIEHDRLILIDDGPVGSFATSDLWRSEDGEIVATDIREWSFRAGDDWRAIDLDITVETENGRLRLGDTKEGTMAVRVAPQLRLEGEVASGRILNSEGQRDGECWGKRARWVDYRGTIDGEVVGVAIFDHPSNLRHPTWWHARGYGLVAANPFGAHDFEKKPPGTGDLVLESDERLRLHYRVVLYSGDWSVERLEQAFEEFSQ